MVTSNELITIAVGIFANYFVAHEAPKNCP